MRSSGTCELCGRALEEHDRDVRFRLPEPVLRLPDQERTEGTWLSEPDPNVAVMMQVPNVGAFVRCLLPVHLSGGYSLRFGVWLGIHPDDLKRAFNQWWEPTYDTLTFDGRLANRLPIWNLYDTPAHAEVVEADATPFIVSSESAELEHVLTDEWPHEDVLSALP